MLKKVPVSGWISIALLAVFGVAQLIGVSLLDTVVTPDEQLAHLKLLSESGWKVNAHFALTVADFAFVAAYTFFLLWWNKHLKDPDWCPGYLLFVPGILDVAENITQLVLLSSSAPGCGLAKVKAVLTLAKFTTFVMAILGLLIGWIFIQKPKKSSESDPVYRQLAETYQNIRWALLVAGGILVFGIWSWSIAEFSTWWPGHSMSGYYHARLELVGDLFSCSLVAVGALLIAYEGFYKWEHWLLNLAGAAVIVVALFPCGVEKAPRFTLARDLPYCGKALLPHENVEAGHWAPGWIHPTAAVVFFVCVGVVTVLCQSPDQSHITTKAYKTRFRRSYWVIGGLMIIFPIASGIWWLCDRDAFKSGAVFWVELFGTGLFMAYWFVKNLEMHGSTKQPQTLRDNLLKGKFAHVGQAK